jgi:hypothetical protein
MKPPSWLVIDPKSEWVVADDRKSVTFHVRLARFWWARPSFWRDYLRMRSQR